MILRPATTADAAEMCALLNPIIAAGGTTAHRRPFTPERMAAHYIAPPRLIACTTAWESGDLLGFQQIEWPDQTYWGDAIPADWAVIATFVRQGHTGRGIGARLFAETCTAARAAGVMAIDATIRRENTGGLRYYDKMGFVDYRPEPERIGKRFDP